MNMRELLKFYQHKMQGIGIAPKREADGLGMNHVMWMINTTIAAYDEWPDTRLHRWIGFIQRGLLSGGVYTLEEMRLQSRGLDEDPSENYR